MASDYGYTYMTNPGIPGDEAIRIPDGSVEYWKTRGWIEVDALAGFPAVPSSRDRLNLVTGAQTKYRREFNDATLAAWEKVESGITIPAPASGVLAIPMGTTANAEGAVVSRQMFTAPFAVAIGVQLSQKIANNEVYAEVVACDESGVLDETVVAAWRIAGSDSVTNTLARTEVRNGGAARLQSGNVTTVAQTGAVAVLELTVESDEVWFTSKPADSVSARTVGQVRNSVAPDPTRLYRIRLRVKNGSVAPASSTTATFSFLTAIDYTELKAEVTGGTGAGGQAQSIPVNVVQGATTGTPAIAASATVTGLNVTKVLSAASTNATLVKSTAGRLYGYQFTNLSAAVKFVRLYNLTTAPTVGTSVPFMVIALPPNQTIDLNITVPVTFSTGISYAVTGAVADLDATAVAANDVQGTLLWL